MKVQVALKLGSCSNAEVLINGDRYVNCMTGNPHFDDPATVALLALCKTSVTDLRAAINAPLTESKTDNIRIARDALDRNITMLGAEVEKVANDPSKPDAQRVEIVHSAGMEVKNQARRSKNVFAVTNTEVSGTVHLIAQGGAEANEWQYTDDVINFTNRIAATSTTAASTDIPNLKKLTEYAFFHRAIKTSGATDWEGPILLLVL